MSRSANLEDSSASGHTKFYRVPLSISPWPCMQSQPLIWPSPSPATATERSGRVGARGRREKKKKKGGKGNNMPIRFVALASGVIDADVFHRHY